MKSFKLIRNINYNVINYIFNFIYIFNHQCYCSWLVLDHFYIVLCGVGVRALDCRSQHSGFKTPFTFKVLFLNFVA